VSGLAIGTYAQRPFGVHAADPRALEVGSTVADLVRSAIPGARIEHVGSTAVPGLPGKGVIDLMLVSPADSVSRTADRLVRLGFQRQGGLDPWPPSRPMLVGSVEWRGRPYQVHLHVIPETSPEVRAHLDFRDALRADPRLRRDYAADKRRLAAEEDADWWTYSAGKGPWIESVLDRIRPGGRGTSAPASSRPGGGTAAAASDGRTAAAATDGRTAAARSSALRRPVAIPRTGRASAAEPEPDVPPESREPILPPATIGILGGGQLGRMLAMAARAAGYRIAVLDPDPECPAAAVADRVVVGRYDDAAAAAELARGCAVVTYELEHVDAALVAAVRGAGVPVRPGLVALRVSQDRLAERRWVEAQGARVARWREVRSAAEVRVALREIGLPARLKAPVGGYDGRSQVRIARESEVAAAWEGLAGPPSSRDARLSRAARPALLLEEELAFEEELSVVVARGPDGAAVAFPVARNVHDAGILVESVAPAPVAPLAVAMARDLGERLAAALGVVGTITVELFLLRDGSLVVNELAPRVHNSGHWSIEGCRTSQFAQHVRAICGLPLGSIEMTGCAATVNLLGTGRDRPARLIGLERALADADVAVHVYDKRRVFARRKMGHVTVVAGSPEEALDRARTARARLAWEA
jgi:5-(carboxyamino)imidazole ribonucleotide synthase